MYIGGKDRDIILPQFRSEGRVSGKRDGNASGLATSTAREHERDARALF